MFKFSSIITLWKPQNVRFHIEWGRAFLKVGRRGQIIFEAQKDTKGFFVTKNDLSYQDVFGFNCLVLYRLNSDLQQYHHLKTDNTYHDQDYCHILCLNSKKSTTHSFLQLEKYTRKKMRTDICLKLHIIPQNLKFLSGIMGWKIISTKFNFF